MHVNNLIIFRVYFSIIFKRKLEEHLECQKIVSSLYSSPFLQKEGKEQKNQGFFNARLKLGRDSETP